MSLSEPTACEQPAAANGPSSRWRAYIHESRRPLTCLLFLAPLLVLAEAVLAANPVGRIGSSPLVATRLLEAAVALLGAGGAWLPSAVVLLTLVGWHMKRRGARWSRRTWAALPLMLAECVLLAIPLAVIGRLLLLAGLPESASLARAVLAGVHEEFVFRLVLVILAIWALRSFAAPRNIAVTSAIALSGVCFAAAHVIPLGGEPPATLPFLLRALAGAYLGMVFLSRGFGLAAGAHAAHNVYVVFMATPAE